MSINFFINILKIFKVHTFDYMYEYIPYNFNFWRLFVNVQIILIKILNGYKINMNQK